MIYAPSLTETAMSSIKNLAKVSTTHAAFEIICNEFLFDDGTIGSISGTKTKTHIHFESHNN